MVKRKKILAGVLVVGLLVTGAVCLDIKEFLSGAAKTALEVTGIKKGVQQLAAGVTGVIRDVKNAFVTVRGLTVAFILLVINFNSKLPTLSYYDDVVSVEVPLDIPVTEGAAEAKPAEEAAEPEAGEAGEKSAEEKTLPATAERRIGLDYNIGFVGSGDVSTKIEPVEGLFVYTNPVKLGKADMPIYASMFLDEIANLIQKYETLIKYVVIIAPLGVALEGIRKVIQSISFILRLRPETVFKAKVLVLMNSVQQGKDNIRWADVPVHMTILLARLANSVNESASAKLVENMGSKYPRNWKKFVYFKDTGISDVLRMKELATIFPLAATIFESAAAFQVPEWMVTEWKERKGRKESTAMELAYSNMRLIKGHLAKSVYFIGDVLRRLFTEVSAFDKTDQEVFLRMVRVHVDERFKGMPTLLEITRIPTGGETVEQQAKRTSEEDMNSLAQVKAVYQDRWGALRDLLEQSLAKMPSKGFSGKHVDTVASFLAKIKSEQQEFDVMLKDVTWNAKFPEGTTLDSVGEEEDPLKFLPEDKAPKMTVDDPFLDSIKEASTTPMAIVTEPPSGEAKAEGAPAEGAEAAPAAPAEESSPATGSSETSETSEEAAK